MTTAAAALLAAVLKLSPADREELAAELWDSLDPPGSDIDRMTDAEFEAELNRRRDESLRDPAAAVPGEDVRRHMLGEDR